jgi:hypothetical protein
MVIHDEGKGAVVPVLNTHTPLKLFVGVEEV